MCIDSPQRPVKKGRLSHEPAEDDCESVHSWQSDETAWVGDSGDDWQPSSSIDDKDGDSPSFISDLNNVETASFLDSDSIQSQGSSSDVERILDIGADVQDCGPPRSCVPWPCLKCSTSTTFPMRYCPPCYQKRKSNLPPRPLHGKMRRRCKDSAGSLTRIRPGGTGFECAALPAGQPSCSLCGVRPPNGAFVHQNTCHSVYCYLCTKLVMKRSTKCPICRRTVQKAVRVFSN